MVMKTSFVFCFTLIFGCVICTRQPLLQWDPDTVEDCVEWYNNGESETCEYVRNYFSITPAQFHEWNPSIGLDCKPWEYQSYCIVTQRRLDNFTTTSAPTTPASTTVVSSALPSPTAWKSLGCYAQNPDRPILQQNMNPNGDASLSIPKCESSCYRQAFTFAGMQEGNQCWCSNYVAGELAKNAADCNVPCTGNKAEVCGGKGVVSVFEALANSAASIVSTTSAIQVAATSTNLKATATSNGGVKNRALFGMEF
ncbi:WSC domain-containing protein [Phaeosphaeria sp. MPI-PUGE-AT-0046c]|nr:WSC domain-containing protein [Phaeosphaeria sp. MPI-PUGE-AT-0046c]